LFGGDFLSKHFISLLTPHPNVFFRLAYQSRAFKHKNLRVRPFKTLFQSNKEKLEFLNSFQNQIFINKCRHPRRCRPGPRPSLATPL